MGIKAEAEKEPNELKELSTFGCLQPLLFDAVADLSLGLAFGDVTFNNGRVAFVNLDLLLIIRLKVTQLWKTQTMEKSVPSHHVNTDDQSFIILIHCVNYLQLHM